MAKIQKIEKSRKEQKCSKCGNIIPVGSEYLKAKPRYRSPIIRCTKCGLRSWETSSSDYIQTVGSLVENWQEDYGVSESTIDDIRSVLEELRDTCQESLDNMPESLQYSETGELLQERIDCLDSAINDLDCIDYDTIFDDNEDDDEDFDNSDAKEDFISQIDDALSGLEY